MPDYRTSVATLDVPPGWRDQSITAFRLPPPPGGSGDASFVMTKDMDKGTTPFADYVAKQADMVARSLPEYAEIKREAFHVHDRDAVWLEFRWTNERTVMQLRQSISIAARSRRSSPSPPRPAISIITIRLGAA